MELSSLPIIMFWKHKVSKIKILECFPDNSYLLLSLELHFILLDLLALIMAFLLLNSTHLAREYNF